MEIGKLGKGIDEELFNDVRRLSLINQEGGGGEGELALTLTHFFFAKIDMYM